MTRKKRLGRGLDALLNSTAAVTEAVSDTIAIDDTGSTYERVTVPKSVAAPSSLSVATESSSQSLPDSDAQGDGSVMNLSVYEIEDNPFQPRREFSEAEIGSLAESLKTHDILQPILVRVVDGRYQLIAGERRLRAAIQANWQTIPARVREADDRLVAELAIVENLQRKDLNAIEKALSFRRYINEHGCTQEDLASRLKLDRSTIANMMRLLELPAAIRDAVGDGSISAGHARALLPLGDERLQLQFSDEIKRDGLSVRATERMVAERIRAEDEGIPSNSLTRKRKKKDSQIESLQQKLKLALGTKVQIKSGSRGRGQIVIHFSSHGEFERLQDLLSESELGRRVA